MVLSSLFYIEICKNGTRGHGLIFEIAKGSNFSNFDSYSVRNSVLIISHISFWDCRMYIKMFSDNLS